MTDVARAVFQAHATTYDDDLRRRLIPPYDGFYGAAVEALALAGESLRRVLDLGAGTGLLSAHVAAAHPDAQLVLLDGAPAMLDRARARLGDHARVTLHAGDLRDPLPVTADGEPYDAIVSALAIHHLDDAAKRDIYARAHDALRPGGVFANAEQVLAPSPTLQTVYREWHRASSAALGTTPAEWAGALERMSVDRYATVEDQLAWLRDAGFPDPDCPFRDRSFGVLVARRGE